MYIREEQYHDGLTQVNGPSPEKTFGGNWKIKYPEDGRMPRGLTPVIYEGEPLKDITIEQLDAWEQAMGWEVDDG